MPELFTNKFNLPTSMFNALTADTYVGGGDISITRLIAPPRIVALKKHHADEIVVDASERVWSLFGQSAHLVLERAAGAGVQVEQRLFMKIEGIKKPDGKPWVWELSGQPDVMEGGILSDYKFTSCWSFMFGDKPEWDAQLNLQALLHRNKGDDITAVRIIAVLRDWQKRKAQFEKDYPQCQINVHNFPLWTFDQQMKYAIDRVKLHQTAQKDFKLSGYDPESLPMCSDEERWFRGAKFEVKKQDKTGKVNKKADRLFDAEDAAKTYMKENYLTLPKGKSWAPLTRKPGVNVRCEDYCEVAMFCPFGRKLKEAKEVVPADAEEEVE